MRERRELADDETSWVTASHTARERPFAARRGDAERVLDVELQRRRPTGHGSLQAGLREKHVDAALRIAQGLHDRTMWTCLTHPADEPRSRRDDHPEPHALGCSPVDLERAAESVGPAPDDLRRDHLVTERPLEVEGPPKGCVL